MTYYASYGPIHRMAASLRDIRIAARKLALDVKYDINIVGGGDVIETVHPFVKGKRWVVKTIKHQEEA